MDESLYLRIKKYNSGLLSDAERQSFEQQVENDPEFAEEVTTLAAIYKGIQEKGDAQLNEDLMNYGRQLLQTASADPELTAKVNPEMVKHRFSMPRWVYAAAAMLLLLVVAVPVFQRFNAQEGTFALAKDLYSEHFKAPAAPTVRGDSPMPWQEAYLKKQYPQAIEALRQILANPNYKRRSEAFLYLGISFSASGQPQQALETLRQINANNFEYEDAQWFMAMAYLQSDDAANARTLLQTIATQTGNPRQKDAAQILRRIK